MVGNNQMFAFGENEYEGCNCPVKEIGENPVMSRFNIPIEKYDEKVAELMGISWGLVEAETAKEVWLEVVDELEEENLHGQESALQVAKELGWVEE